MTISGRRPGAPCRLRPADLAGDEHGPFLDRSGQIRDPLVCIDLDDEPEPAVVAAAVEAAEASERILVGIATRAPIAASQGPLMDALDLTLVPTTDAVAERDQVAVADPVARAAELHSSTRENPQAATVLAGLLRWSGSLPVPLALDAESLAYSTLLGGGEFERWLDRRGPRPPPPPAAADPVVVGRDGPLLQVTLNRPERRNAYGRELRDGLVAALETAMLDPGIERVQLDGVGPSFSSGGDLAEFGTAPDLATAHFVRTRAGAGRLLHDLADRVDVRLHGTCVGAGIELSAFAGRVVAAPTTTFRLPEVAMGLIPGAGGTVSVPRRIGRWRTLYLSLTGTDLDVGTALEWGLVDHIEA